MLIRLVFNSAKLFFAVLQRIGQRYASSNAPLFLVPTDLPLEDKKELLQRLVFFAPDQISQICFISSLSFADFFSTKAILVFGGHKYFLFFAGRIRDGIFNVDFRHNPNDGWDWCKFAKYVSSHRTDIIKSKQRFNAYVAELRSLNLQKCYIFGTGVSLGRADERDWVDGYRVVCNTIVRDSALWKHIDPHFIVAADAIYHFGFTEYARAFRRDLYNRLSETRSYFIYPELFDVIVSREFSAFSERLIPIPCGYRKYVHINLACDFELPGLGNVLNLILLPLACTLSKSISMWGFDGRAPNDKHFWANSIRHSYPELSHTLQSAHPAFFEHFVPAHNPYKYVNKFHGDELDLCISKAEKNGWKFIMMHESWTEALHKRYSADNDKLYG